MHRWVGKLSPCPHDVWFTQVAEMLNEASSGAGSARMLAFFFNVCLIFQFSEPQKAHPTGGGGGGGSSCNFAQQDYGVSKVLYSPYTAEYKEWKRQVISRAQEELQAKCAEVAT